MIGQIIDKLIVEIELKVRKNKGVEVLDKKMDAMQQRATNLSAAIKNSFMNIQNTLLGAGLSFLFTGMAINRFFQTMLMSLFQTFLLVEGEQGVVNEKINELKARLAFLKFSLIDAFAETGVLDKWLDRLDSLIDKFDKLEPDKKANLVDFAVKAALAGAALMVIGQVMLGVLGVLSLFGGIVKGITALLVGGIGAGTLVGAILLVVVAILLMVEAMGGFGNFFKAVAAGVGKSLLDHIASPIIWVMDRIRDLIRLLSDLAFALGMEGVGSALSAISFGVHTLGTEIAMMQVAMGKAIDESLGVNDIRASIESKWANPMSWLLGTGFDTPAQAPSTDVGTSSNNTTININPSNMTVLSEMDFRNMITKAIEDAHMFNQGSPQT